ncbi:hypothetical protein AC51_4949 [Escherichia coli 5-172-05_S3_C3]|nr:hypothetical protein AC51_4949 [Escherichia coli 5-172-05_S3_C3]
MFNWLSTCQPAFPHQSSCQLLACINATLAQHLTDCPATAAPRLRAWKALTRLRNSILCTLTGRFTCA